MMQIQLKQSVPSKWIFYPCRRCFSEFNSHPLPTCPQACSFARPLFRSLVRSPPGKGKETAAMQANHMKTTCIQSKVFHRKRLEPRLLPWQQHSRCHSVSFVMYISGANAPIFLEIFLIQYFKFYWNYL